MMKQNEGEELAVIAEIARMYYLEGMSQLEIADTLFFSKAKVSRALKLAREKNIVEFHINIPLSRSLKLETELKNKFGLKEALVVTDLSGNRNSYIAIKRIGEMTASYLDELLKDGDVIGLSWGRTMFQTVSQLNPSRSRKIEVVQVVGNSTDSYNLGMDATTLTQKMADIFGGTATKLYAPMYVSSDIVRKELLKEPIVCKAIERIKETNYILTGIADVSLKSPLSTWAGYLTQDRKKDLVASGAVGYLCGNFLDKNGNGIPGSYNDKIIGISFDEIRNAPCVIAAAGGVDKSKSIYAALKGNLINCLITDSWIAEKLLIM